jgi:Asp-tRNA(Asn)/Glu-tRNA(Gln) amidotransferase A subunit family amidase
VLHYVDGAVELDLILPAALSVEDAARLTAAVAARWGREVHVRVLVRS